MARRLPARRLLVAALACMTSVASAWAQDPPDRERGFRPEMVYDVRGIDAIDVQSGNLNLTIPLTSFGVSADVSYSFVLRYSGHLWKASEKCADDHGTCSTKWMPQVDNAGLGWRLSLGELQGDALYPDPESLPSNFPPNGHGVGTAVGASYVSGDASRHLFFETLHEPACTTGGQTNCDVKTPNVYYTRDNSYLRLVDLGDARIVEFPDGMRQRFVKDTTTDEWLLQYIYGVSSAVNPSTGVPTTNWVRFEYLPHDAATSNVVNWRVTDSVGRTHHVYFQLGMHGSGIVDRVEVAAFASSAPAVYQITYDNPLTPVDGPATVVPRPYEEINGSPTATLRLLSRVDLPGPVGGAWIFKYRPAVSGYDPFSATLVEAVLPSSGSILWSYQEFPAWSEGSQSDKTIGVFERTLPGAQRTRYVLTPNDQVPRTVEEYVPGSAGNGLVRKTVSFFYLTSNAPAALKGLPMHPNLTDGSAAARRLSSEVYECDPTSASPSCSLQRRLWAKYEWDEVLTLINGNCLPTATCARDVNRRVVSERTLYVTDGNRYADVDFSDFDGLGHYRSSTTGGNFGAANVKTSYTAYNTNSRGFDAQTQIGSSVGTYSLTSSNTRAGGFTMLAATDPWILNTYTSTSTTEAGRSYHTEACFDRTTGFLRLLRRQKPETGGSTSEDVVTQYLRDATGYPSREEQFGGDGGNVPLTPSSPGTLCGLFPLTGNTASYRIDRSYQYGALATARFVNPQTGTDLGFKLVDYTIDQNTGLVKEARDVSGLATTYSYHPSGHLQTIATPGTAATTYTYDVTSVPRKVSIQRGSGTDALKSSVEFDVFGRVKRTLSLMPHDAGGSDRWSAVDVTYDALGRKSSSSEPYEPNVQSPALTSFQFDAFDRSTRVAAPDGSVTRTTYGGVREVTKFSSVQTGTGETEVPVVEEYDRQGRLWKVTEKSGPTSDTSPIGALVTTTYGYDPADRLVSVSMTGSGTTQFRTFGYDGRGFLQSESHPEGGLTTYTYDARGNVLTKRHGTTSGPFDLDYSYDRAARLTEVRGWNPFFGTVPADPGRPQFRVMRTFAYGTANATGDARNGKLVNAARYNYDPFDEYGITYKVAESYVYGDAAGRRTAKRTAITKGSGTNESQWTLYKTVEMAVVHDELDQPVEITYPMCWDCGAPVNGPWRDQRTTYDQGRPKSVQGFLSDVAYWPNGMWKSMLRSNGMTDEQTADSNGMTRPKEISSRFSTDCSPPVIGTQPEGGVISSGGSIMLTVSAFGTGPFTYAWREGTSTGSPVIGTGSTFVASPSSTKTYSATATNACGTAQSIPATVSVNECVPPGGTITVDPLGDKQHLLTVTASGSEPRTYEWRRTPGAAVIGRDRTLTVGPLNGTATYTVTIANDCPGSPAVVTATVSDAALPAWNVSATKITDTKIRVQWTGAASSFGVERRSDASGWKRIHTTSNVLYDDTTVQPGKTYAYRVTSGNFTSSADVATTGTFPQAVAGGPITASSFNSILAAVNSVRAAFGWPTLTWSTVVSTPYPVPMAVNALIRTEHLGACRQRMNEALGSLGVVTVPWAVDSNVVPGNTMVKASQINEIIGKAY